VRIFILPVITMHALHSLFSSPPLFSGDQWLAPKYLLWMWRGFQTTLLLSAVTVLLSTLLGLLLAAAHGADDGNNYRPLRAAAIAFTSLFRNTPLLVQLLFWYFGLPSLFADGWMEWLNATHSLDLGVLTLNWPSFEFLAAMFGLVLYSTAYISEEIRAGIRGVPASQTLAAAAIGLTPVQVQRYIVLPQAVRLVLPPLLGQYMNILKNTSLTMGIGLAELSYTSRQVEAETFRTFQAFGVATLLYIAAIAVIESIGHWHLQNQSARRTKGAH
jgi:polar amino acid transport system permease protein